MKFNDAIFGAVLLILGIAVLVHVPSFPQMAGQKVGPALFPGLIAAGLVACALILIVNGEAPRDSAVDQHRRVDTIAPSHRRILRHDCRRHRLYRARR